MYLISIVQQVCLQLDIAASLARLWKIGVAKELALGVALACIDDASYTLGFSSNFNDITIR